LGARRREYQNEYEYLSMLNQLMEISDVSQLGMMDKMRAEIHRKIMNGRKYSYEENNEEFYRRSKVLMSNLDVLMGFNPPQYIGNKASELHELVNSDEFQAFLEGKIETITTQYGTIKA
jgi:hypothetical protein